MGRYLRAAVTAATLLASTITSVVADDSIPSCGPGNPCPASAPCCSAYGQCGVGAYCLGGCDPLFSHSLNSCVPNPVCQSKDYQLNSLDDVTDISKYLGDSSKTNWVSSGRPLVYNNQGILLTMPPDTVGTLLASTHYVWYGKICTTMTTSQGAGVVTAFIMMSDVKDEIDFEFVGVDVQHGQSNYYSQGVTNYNNEINVTASDTSTTVHEYCIDWQPDSLTWMVDGQSLRTKQRSETWNATANRFDYPQTPARIMLSLWPAGLPSTAKGTVEWAGGYIDWNSPYMKSGYYYAMVSDVTVQCYDPPSGSKFSSGSAAYSYTDAAGTNNTIAGTSAVILKSLQASGEDPSYDPYGTGSASATKSGSAPTATAQSVPGVVGAGDRGDSSGSQSSSGSGSSSDSGSASSGSTGAGQVGFSQGLSGSSSGNSGSGTSSSGVAGLQGQRLGSGSAFAILVVTVAALTML